MTRRSEFDLDYSRGLVGENLVDTLLRGGNTVEVKTDLKWKNTGNLYIETECWYQSSQSWEPSGLNASTADYWAFVLEGLVLMVPTAELRRIVGLEGHAISNNMPPNPSRGYLIKPEDILQITRKNPLP